MKNDEHYQEMIDNYINGNLSDYKQQVVELTREETSDFVAYICSSMCHSPKFIDLLLTWALFAIKDEMARMEEARK